MKDKIIFVIIFVLAFAIGSVIGNIIGYFIWPHQRHLCQCEYCKTVRQREALEMIDSVIHERIVINVNKEK